MLDVGFDVEFDIIFKVFFNRKDIFCQIFFYFVIMFKDVVGFVRKYIDFINFEFVQIVKFNEIFIYERVFQFIVFCCSFDIMFVIFFEMICIWVVKNCDEFEGNFLKMMVFLFIMVFVILWSVVFCCFCCEFFDIFEVCDIYFKLIQFICIRCVEDFRWVKFVIFFFFDVIVRGMDFFNVIYVVQVYIFNDCDLYIYCIGCMGCVGKEGEVWFLVFDFEVSIVCSRLFGFFIKWFIDFVVVLIDFYGVEFELFFDFVKRVCEVFFKFFYEIILEYYKFFLGGVF